MVKDVMKYKIREEKHKVLKLITGTTQCEMILSRRCHSDYVFMNGILDMNTSDQETQYVPFA